MLLASGMCRVVLVTELRTVGNTSGFSAVLRKSLLFKFLRSFHQLLYLM